MFYWKHSPYVSFGHFEIEEYTVNISNFLKIINLYGLKQSLSVAFIFSRYIILLRDGALPHMLPFSSSDAHGRHY